MGWTFGYKDVSELGKKIIGDGAAGDCGPGFRCLAYSAPTPEGDRMVIWTVQRSPKGERFILCNLIELDPRMGDWGYKVMEEASGPHYYSVPLEFLDLAPCPGAYGTAWREKVRAYQGDRAPLQCVKSLATLAAA